MKSNPRLSVSPFRMALGLWGSLPGVRCCRSTVSTPNLVHGLGFADQGLGLRAPKLYESDQIHTRINAADQLTNQITPVSGSDQEKARIRSARGTNQIQRSQIRALYMGTRLIGV